MTRTHTAPPCRLLLAAAALVPVLLAPGAATPAAPAASAAPPVPPGLVPLAGGAAPGAAVLDVLDRRTPASGWRPPVAGPPRVLRPFAPGAERWSPGHRGVDLELTPGGAVLAAGAGRVVFAGPVAGRGVVSVAHGALRTTYEPVLPAVAAGDAVAAGSPLGVLAPGHGPCGGCLHWGLRRGEDYLDPMRLLRPVRVRLLPLTGPRP